VPVVCYQPIVETVVTCTDAAGVTHNANANMWCSWIRTWDDGTQLQIDVEDKLVTCLQCIAEAQRNVKVAQGR
jgi:hypothetical protein